MVTRRTQIPAPAPGEELDVLTKIISELRSEHQNITGAILAPERFERLSTKTSQGSTKVRSTRKSDRPLGLNLPDPQARQV
jgi:ribosomal protein L19